MIPGLKNIRAIESVRIAIGEKGETGKKLPTKLSHFIFTTTEKKGNRYLRDPILTDLFGDKPKKNPIMLLSDNIDVALPTFYAKYARSGVKLRSDDATNWTMYNDDGTRTLTVCDPDNCKFFEDKDVKPHAILTGVVDCDSMENNNHIGEKLFKFRTTAWNTMHALIYEMNRIKDACSGHLAYLPLNLIVFPKMVRPKGQAGEVLAYIVSLEPRTTMADLRMHAAANANSLAAISHRDGAMAREAARISDPDEETIEDQIAIKEEFSPDAEDVKKLPSPAVDEDSVVAQAEAKRADDDAKAAKDGRKLSPAAHADNKAAAAKVESKRASDDEKTAKTSAKKTPKPTAKPKTIDVHESPKNARYYPIGFPAVLEQFEIPDYAMTVTKIDERGTHCTVNGRGIWHDLDADTWHSNAPTFNNPMKCIQVRIVAAVEKFGADAVTKAFPNVNVIDATKE